MPAFAGLFLFSPIPYAIPPKAGKLFYFYKFRILSTMDTRKASSYIIGIDEVGRGPLAGPVVVCAVAVPRTHKVSSIARHLPLRDSKKLTANQRAAWAAATQQDSHIQYAITSVAPSVIDRINITQAANHAATRTLIKILSTLPASSRVAVFLDGGLFIQQNSKFEILYSKNNSKKKFLATFHDQAATRTIDLKVETIIKGDEKIPAISLASIVAKEHRDAVMRRAHKKYPNYGFDRHAGYGTKKHIAAIKQHGRSPLHRNSFLKKIAR